jgi:signal transduction histidine kinase
LEQLQHTGQQMVQELRRLIGALRPVYLEDLGFLAALEMLVRQVAERTDVQVRLEHGQTTCSLAPQVELAAYRIVQEALNNAIQHASAQQITVGVHCTTQALLLSVVDDGIGFVFPAQPDLLTASGHFGLIGMRERATQLGGMLDVRTEPGQGTRISVRLPTRPADQ